jgi:hypothetical protein
MNCKQAIVALTLFSAWLEPTQAVRANDVVAPDGTDAYFALGWAAAADEMCSLNTYRIILLMGRSHGLTDADVAQNVPKIAKAIAQANREMTALGRNQWCANYQRGLLTGK